MTKAGTMHLFFVFFIYKKRVRSSLAVIESNRIGSDREEGRREDQNVSTLQKFTAECSLSTLNGRITMTSL